MIWEFKRLIYCSRERVPVAHCADLGDPTVRARLQRYFHSLSGFPPAESPDEYAYYFEAAFPDEQDRRRYIDQRVEAGSPSFGHLVLAALMRADKVRVIWTTNFDAMVEDAVAQVFGTTGKLVAATPESAEMAIEALNEGRFPVLGKLHGDFRSRRLKNIEEELRQQDARLREALVETCRRFGLAVIGYSGRDVSIMNALEEAIDRGRGYPAGLFWLHRGDNAPLASVTELLEQARRAGVRAEIVESQTFDEVIADLRLLEPNLPEHLSALLDERRQQRVSSAPPSPKGSGFPVIRLNALPVIAWPTACRLVDCEIGGTREVREAVANAEAPVIAARRASGVIAFGSDEEVRRAFDPFGIRSFDLHAIEAGRLRWESAERGLLYDALTHAFSRGMPLITTRHRGSHRLAIDPEQSGDERLQPVRRLVGEVTGLVCGKRRWAEAVGLRLDYHDGRLWLLLDPTIWVDQSRDMPVDETAREFIRNRLASRFNRDRNALLEAWRDLLLRGNNEREVRAFGLADGVDAVFRIAPVTAYTRRGVQA